MSHKISRLAVPWCLVVLLAASGALSWSRPRFRLLLAVQAAFYLLALVGWAASRFRRPVRLLSVPYMFAVLNLAAALGLIRLLRGTETAAWKETSR